jgi:hypothetical protein
VPNSFSCDRIGIAVWLRKPAVEVTAAIAGRRVSLDDPDWSVPEQLMYAGFLQPAGLIHGPLKLTADASHDRWIGREPMSVPLTLRIVRKDGTVSTTRLRARLSPGWG